jgi:hypothetical protein
MHTNLSNLTSVESKVPLIGAFGPKISAVLAASANSSNTELGNESQLPDLSGAIGWLNSVPLKPQVAAGKGRTRRFLDLHLHQLAAAPTLCEGLGG